MYLHHLAYLVEEPPAIKDLVKEKLKAAIDGAKVLKTIHEKALRLCDAEAAKRKCSVSTTDCLIKIVAAFPKLVEMGVMNLSDHDTSSIDVVSANFSQIKFANI